MKSLCLTLIILLSASLSHARGPNSIYGVLGFRSGTATFGAQFEHRLKATHGIAGYALIASKDSGKAQQIGVTSIGGVIPVHFGANRWDLYVAPGFGFHMMDFASTTLDDQNALGPLVKLGVLYRFTRELAFGVEYMKTFNWLNGDTPFGEFDFMNLSGKYTF